MSLKDQTPTMGHDEFERNPGKAVRRAVDEGRIAITRDDGTTIIVITAPSDVRAVRFDSKK